MLEIASTSTENASFQSYDQRLLRALVEISLFTYCTGCACQKTGLPNCSNH